MKRALGIVVVGSGLAGVAAAEAITRRRDMRLEGWISTNPAKSGADASTFADVPVGLATFTSAEEADELFARPQVDVAFYAGVNEPDAVIEWLGRAASAGLDVVSVAGPVHPQISLGVNAAETLHAMLVDAQVRALSTGVNPGLLLDTLPMLCATLSPTGRVHVRATRRSDIRWWGQSVLTGYGVGQRAEGWVVDAPYVTLRESAQMIVDGLDLAVDDIDETYAPVVASESRLVAGTQIDEGCISGFVVSCVARKADEELVRLEWVGEFGGAEIWNATGAPWHELKLAGDVTVSCSLGGDFLADSYPATVGRALNSLSSLRTLAPGLYRPDQIPLSPLPKSRK